jgi:hypothetical protein
MVCHHIVIQVIYDPDREDNNDDDHGNREDENNQIPTRPFFTKNIQKTDRLRNELKKRKKEKEENIRFHPDMKKLGMKDDEKSDERKYEGTGKSDDANCQCFMHRLNPSAPWHRQW